MPRFASSSRRAPASFIAAALLACALLAVPARAQLTYKLAPGFDAWPAAKRTAIINAMNEAVVLYNAHGYFPRTLTANYNASVPTAQAGYSGWIDFGGSISSRVALHEMGHTMGAGTFSTWASLRGSGTWTGPRATARVKLFAGPSASVGCDSIHFWPYGLNFDSEDGATNRIRHVKLVAALRWDMGIVTDSDADGLPDDWEQFHFGNLAQPATADPDLDGTANLAEYSADTDPSQLTALTWTAGSATWDTSAATWTGPVAIWRNALFDQAVFAAPAGTVTLASGVQAGDLVFNSTGYTLGGAALALTGPSPSLTAATGVSATISSVLTGSTGLAKNGPGTLTLSGSSANTFTGTTAVRSGILVLAKSPGVTALAGPVSIGDLSGSDILLVAASEQIADTATVSFNSGGGGNSAFLRINGGTTETVAGIVTTVTEQAPVIESGSAGVATLVVNNPAACTYDGILRNAAGGTLALVKTGAGNLVLQNSGGAAPAAFTGPTTVSAGTLTLNSLLGATGSKLVLNSFASPLTTHAALVFDQAAGLLETFAPLISGTGTLKKLGGGTLILNRANSFSGGTTLGVGTASGTVGGILRLAHGSALGTGPVSVLAGNPGGTHQGAQLQLSGGITVTNSPFALSGLGYGANNGVLLNLDGDNSVTGLIQLQGGAGGSIIAATSGTLTLGPGGITTTYASRTLEFTGSGNFLVSGVITNGLTTTGLPVTKSGTGTLTLSALNTATGPLTVSAGTLAARGSAALGGSLDLQSAARFAARPGDTLTVAGSVSLAGELDVLPPTSVITSGTSFTLLNKTSPGPVSGIFTGVPEGALFTAAGRDWIIRYTGGDGNDVALTAATALENWRWAHFSTVADTGPSASLADPDADGEPNLLEFATGQDPAAATLRPPSLALNDLNLELTYVRSAAALATGLVFTVEWSDTLAPGSWQSSGVTETILSDTGALQSVKAAVTRGAGDRRFLRLRMSLP